MATNSNIKGFTTFCKNFIIDNLPDYEGETYYACDLGSYITEGINCDGSFTYSRAEAMDYLREWWDEASEYWDYESFNFGEHYYNPFDNPEAFTVCMVIEGVRGILARLPFIDQNWNDEIKLTKRNIKTIFKQLDDLGEISVNDIF